MMMDTKAAAPFGHHSWGSDENWPRLTAQQVAEALFRNLYGPEVFLETWPPIDDFSDLWRWRLLTSKAGVVAEVVARSYLVAIVELVKHAMSEARAEGYEMGFQDGQKKGAVRGMLRDS
jgi:hypothetical protein